MTSDVARAWQDELDARAWRNRANASTIERDRLAHELGMAHAQAEDATDATNERDALRALLIIVVVWIGLTATCAGLALINGAG